MKKFFIPLVALTVSSSIFSAEPFTLSKVIQAEGVSKDAIYSAVMGWVGTNFSLISEDTQITDREAGLIVKPAVFNYGKNGIAYVCYSGRVFYKLKVQVRDGRFKVDLTSFSHGVKAGNAKECGLGLITEDEEYTNKGMSKKYHNEVWADIKKKAEAEAEKIFEAIAGIDFFGADQGNDW